MLSVIILLMTWVPIQMAGPSPLENLMDFQFPWNRKFEDKIFPESKSHRQNSKSEKFSYKVLKTYMKHSLPKAYWSRRNSWGPGHTIPRYGT